MRRTVLLVVTMLLALVLSAPPAGAHSERKLHRALKALKNTNEKQARQIRNLNRTANQLAELAIGTLCLTLIHENDLMGTWDNLNAEPNLTLVYPTIDGVEECEAPAARTSADALGQALSRMHAVQMSRAQ